MSLTVKHSKEEASKEHPKPPSSVIDLDSDEDTEIEAEDWQKAKYQQSGLKTPHANSMPDAKVKKNG
jgi:hypothetical protein